MSARLDIGRRLGADAVTQHARWDARTWADLVDGPAERLERALGPGGERVLTAYLELCAEGVALGHLFPASTSALGFLNAVFREVIPARLYELPEGARLPTLAALWNLGENLEAQPPWVSAIFLRRLQSLPRLDALEALVDEVSAELARTPLPGAPLRRAVWVDPSEHDARFLPGPMHFLTPVILCVHDRLRTAGGGRPAATAGVWLTDQPLLLGPMRCAEAPALELKPTLDLSSAMRNDPLIDEVLATARSDAGLVIGLRTSQRLVAVVP